MFYKIDCFSNIVNGGFVLFQIIGIAEPVNGLLQALI